MSPPGTCPPATPHVRALVMDPTAQPSLTLLCHTTILAAAAATHIGNTIAQDSKGYLSDGLFPSCTSSKLNF